MGFITDTFALLIQIAFSLYLVVILLRLILQYFGFDFRNQIMGLLYTLTNPWSIPLRKIFPVVKRIDTSLLVGAFAVQMAKVYLIFLVHGFAAPAISGILLVSFAGICKVTLKIFFYSIIGSILLSWLNPFGMYHPAFQVVHGLSEPLLRPARRFIPPISGIDLSPMLVLTVLWILQRALTSNFYV